MGFNLPVSISALTVFLQGILSFFSPCVLPLIPIYIGYLSGGTATKGPDGKNHYDRKKVLTNTTMFVIGISFAFFLLGLGVTAVARALISMQKILVLVGGILIIALGLHQIFRYGRTTILSHEYRLPFHVDALHLSPLTALVMGFLFSFAWTPCVGPALATVLMMVANSQTKAHGFLLIAVYTLGFILPFLAVGLFTTSLLDLFQKHARVVLYSVRIGGVLMVIIGLFMVTGQMNILSGYLASFGT